MKKLIHLPLMISLPFLLGAVSTPQLTTRDVTFTVETTDGHPVGGALVEASRPGPGNASGLTNEDGIVVLDISSGSTLHVHVSKDGYYATSGELWTGGVHKGTTGNLVAREVPDGFIITLKPVINPVAMKVTRFRGRAPAIGKPLGFDLNAGDWIAPHGRGRTADLLFQFHDWVATPDAFTGTMKIAFPHEGDGIQSFQAARPYSTEFGSNLAPPHQAPVDGYLPSISHTISQSAHGEFQTYRKSQRNYLLRTRTLRDRRGVIRQACYGWIEGEIEFDPRDEGSPQLSFTAYFNPDPNPDARSLEILRIAPENKEK
jgi:hypothetical protein